MVFFPFLFTVSPVSTVLIFLGSLLCVLMFRVTLRWTCSCELRALAVRREDAVTLGKQGRG